MVVVVDAADAEVVVKKLGVHVCNLLNTLHFSLRFAAAQQDGCPLVTGPKIRAAPVTPLVSDPPLQSSY